MDISKWNYSSRRIFNDIVLMDFLRDNARFGIVPRNVLDFGCGDAYLLYQIKEKYPRVNAFCIEENKIRKQGINYISLKDISSYKFDFVFLVDVLYLLSIAEIKNLFSIFRGSVVDKGVIYILIGIYKGSTGNYIFTDFIKNLEKDIYEHSLEQLCDIFEDSGFEVYIKKLDFHSIFGFKVSAKLYNIKQFLDYLYNDKILIKLTKIDSNLKNPHEP